MDSTRSQQPMLHQGHDPYVSAVVIVFLQGAWVHGAVGTVGTELFRREAAFFLFHCFSTAKAVGT